MAMGDMWMGGIQNVGQVGSIQHYQGQMQNQFVGLNPYNIGIQQQQQQYIDYERQRDLAAKAQQEYYFGSQLAISSNKRELSNLEWLDFRIEEVSHKL